MYRLTWNLVIKEKDRGGLGVCSIIMKIQACYLNGFGVWAQEMILIGKKLLWISINPNSLMVSPH